MSRTEELAFLAYSSVQVTVKDGEDFLLKKGTPKDSQGFGPYQNKPFRGPHQNKKIGFYRKRPCGGNSSQNSNQLFSSGGGNRTTQASEIVFDPTQGDEGMETRIQSLLSKNAMERVENVNSLGFYSRLFLVPKSQQRWRPVIDLSRLNTFLLVERFKMETPESIRASLIPGEWVSSYQTPTFTSPST